jgi:hypothetical protein
MNDQSAYLVRAVRGPITMITLGVLFAFDRFTGFHFSQSWPILLIVAGLLRLVGGGDRRDWRGNYPPRASAQPEPGPQSPSWDEPGTREPGARP